MNDVEGAQYNPAIAAALGKADDAYSKVEKCERDIEVFKELKIITEQKDETTKETLRELKEKMSRVENRVAIAEGRFQGQDISKQIADQRQDLGNQISELRQQLSGVLSELGAVKGSTMKGHNPRDPPKSVAKGAPVFISYSRLDEQWVNEKLIPHFRTPALRDVYYLLDTEHFEFGADFEEEINKALRSSQAVISVLSKNYLESDWATAENLAAKRIIPILIEQCELPTSIARSIYLDFTGEESTWPWDKLTGALLRI